MGDSAGAGAAGGAGGGAAGGGGPPKTERPLGPDGKPIPGPEDMRKIQSQRKMNQQQAQVDEVIGIMHKNVEAVLERDSKLSALEERADALQDGSAQFEKRAASLKNKFWLENLKSMIAMGVVGVLLLGLVYWNFFHQSQPAYPYPYPPPPPPQAAPAAPAAGGGDAAAGGDGGGGEEGA